MFTRLVIYLHWTVENNFSKKKKLNALYNTLYPYNQVTTVILSIINAIAEWLHPFKFHPHTSVSNFSPQGRPEAHARRATARARQI
jgi:hypothetical protein